MKSKYTLDLTTISQVLSFEKLFPQHAAFDPWHHGEQSHDITEFISLCDIKGDIMESKAKKIKIKNVD